MRINRKKKVFYRKKYLEKKYKNKKAKKNNRKLFFKILLIILFISEIEYNFLLYESFLNILGKKSTTKVGLCVIAKRENLYLKFFVNYYKHLGYDHIYLYDNNDINDEKVEDAVKKYINNGYITLIDYRGFKGPKDNTQMVAYYDCYEKYNKEYSWLSFFDVDEYLALKPKGIKIQKFLESERYKDCLNIKFNWLVFSDNDQIKYENKPLTKRFTKVTEFNLLNKNIKSTIRGNISHYKYRKTFSPHYFYYNLKSCSSSGKIIKNNFFIEPPDYEFAILKHFYTKSISEFVNKVKRGRVGGKYNINKRKLKKIFNVFFKISNKTKEKVKIFNDAFNTSFK